MEVSRLFQGSFKGVSRMFKGSFKSVSRKFKECFKEVSRVFQRSFKSVIRKFQENFEGVSIGKCLASSFIMLESIVPHVRTSVATLYKNRRSLY